MVNEEEAVFTLGPDNDLKKVLANLNSGNHIINYNEGHCVDGSTFEEADLAETINWYLEIVILLPLGISKINTEKDRSLDWAFGLGQVAQHIRSHMWRRHLHTRHLGGAHSEFSSPCDFTRSTSVLSVKPRLLSFSVFDLGHPWSIGRKRVDSNLGKSWSVKSWFCPIFSRTVKSATWSLL